VLAHFFVLVYEEPTLHRQFGDEYDRYRHTCRAGFQSSAAKPSLRTNILLAPARMQRGFGV